MAFTLLLSFCIPVTGVKADTGNAYELRQRQARPSQEVFLSFNYQNLFNNVVVALYDDGNYYLPVSEVFSMLKIPHSVNLSPPMVTGSFLSSDNSFVFDFTQYTVELDSKGSFTFDASQMLVEELDFYVAPEVLERVFDLEFSVDFNNLLLKLETPHEMPVLAEFRRSQERERQQRYTLQHNFYPLRFDRERKLFAGGFLDYSLSANVNDDLNLYTYNLKLGTELLGGDLQGASFGSFSSSTTNFLTENLRWRYVLRENPAISQVYLGQTVSDGLAGRPFLGVRVTNEPIEPRYIYDEFEIEGVLQPESEVELYFNDALYDYQKVDQNGRYRFLAPLTYGASRLRLRFYDPAGGVRDQTRRIRIPYNFLPTGELNYHLNVGQLENPIFGSTELSYLAQGDLAYGISNWLTQKVGVEYLDQYADETPLYYSSTSARISQEYLFNIDAAPTAFYRVSTSAVYGSSASYEFDYTWFVDDNNIYNILGNDHEFTGNIYLPFRIVGVPMNLRFLGNHTINGDLSRTRYRADFNSRFNRLNLRFSYSDVQTGMLEIEPTVASELSSAVTYFTGRGSSTPGFLRGMFLRGQLDYNPRLEEIVQVEAQLSRNLFRSGRIQASFSRNFLADLNMFSLGITFDLKGIRSSTSARYSDKGSNITQHFLGSVGFDQSSGGLVFSNRQQVGRAATSVRLFVDNNNNGTYDEGDLPIEDNAVRIGRSGITTQGNNGLVRLSQLQAYNQINMEINKSAIKNPMLVPELEQFSFVTDPNRYKPIEIPFYMSGVVSGTVQRIRSNDTESLAGMRVYLESADDTREYNDEIRTFNDGTFYFYEVPPGNYRLYVDAQQLDFLDAVSRPDTMSVEVEALAEGDFVEDLSFSIYPRTAWPAEEEVITAAAPVTNDSQQYQVQVASYVIYDNAVEALQTAENRYNQTFSLRYNPPRRLYAVRTAPITGLRAAVEELLRIQRRQANQPVLVVWRQGQTVTANGDDTYSVQIGAFSTRKRAERFMIQSKSTVGLDLHITYDLEDRLYKVRTSSFQTRRKAEEGLRNIRNRKVFGDAFIPGDTHVIYDGSEGTDFFYRVRIDGLGGTSEQQVRDRLRGTRGAENLDMNRDPGSGSLSFDNISSWELALRIKRRLSGMTEGSEPVIFLIEK